MIKFINLLSQDKDFIEKVLFISSTPVIVYRKATSRFIQSDLYKRLKETGVPFEIVTRKEYEKHGICS